MIIESKKSIDDPRFTLAATTAVFAPTPAGISKPGIDDRRDLDALDLDGREELLSSGVN
jgi:hypothetical protein